MTLADTSTKRNETTGRPAGPATPIAVARGDGIGPEIMDAVLHLLQEAGARLEFHPIEIGAAVYEQGITSGIRPEAWDVLRGTPAFLKAPITTPQGGGYKSLNVTVRKTLGLFANVRPCRTFHPFIQAPHHDMDLVIVRENEEDTYGGIEHRETHEVAQCLKLITRPGSEKVIRYAFEYARVYGRKKVTCLTKDNIMKVTDGLFHKTFDRIAREYPEIESEHKIIDIGTALVARHPEWFDVVVTPNLYGDIVSDVAAEQSGSVGLAGSMNIGDRVSMFEAVHGSAPDIAGQDAANPSGLLQAAILMLHHLGQPDPAGLLQNAWLKTLEDGILTGDMLPRGSSAAPAGTGAFTRAVADRLGQAPGSLRPAVSPPPGAVMNWTPHPAPKGEKTLVGIDVFLDWDEAGRDPNALGPGLEAAADGIMDLIMITNRGTKVYPDGHPETFCTDHWRCRFRFADRGAGPYAAALQLQQALSEAGYDIIKTENLYEFDGVPGFSLGQGE